jgi:hypothetical protein
MLQRHVAEWVWVGPFITNGGSGEKNPVLTLNHLMNYQENQNDPQTKRQKNWRIKY